LAFFVGVVDVVVVVLAIFCGCGLFELAFSDDAGVDWVDRNNEATDLYFASLIGLIPGQDRPPAWPE